MGGIKKKYGVLISSIPLTLSVESKAKQSHYRPWQALRIPGGWGSQISRQSAHEGGKVVSPTHQSPLPPRNYSWYSFLLETESTPGPILRPEGLCQWKIPMTPSGIEPANFWLVAQCLNQLRHQQRAPPFICNCVLIIIRASAFSHNFLEQNSIYLFKMWVMKREGKFVVDVRIV